MKRKFITLLIAHVVIPAYAAPLNPDDWITNAPNGIYTFQNDGSLKVAGNPGENDLFFCGETFPLQQGGVFSITLKFDTNSFLNDKNTAFVVSLYKDNSHVVNGNLHDMVYIMNYDNQLNIYNSKGTKFDELYTLSSEIAPITQITMSCKVENSELQYFFTINDELIQNNNIGKIDTNAFMQPALRIAYSETNLYTVTDVTFSAPIPEPTTATLSLLALAGLAARRRRK